MNCRVVGLIVCFGMLGSGLALAGDKEAMIASAESAGPASVTAKATIKAPDDQSARWNSPATGVKRLHLLPAARHHGPDVQREDLG
jgi:hypothetical protein